MARDFIKVNTADAGATASRLLVAYKDALRLAFNLGTQCLGVANHNNDGTVWTDMEALFGLPAGKGQTVYDLLNGSIGSMLGQFQTADAHNLTETLG